MKLKDPAQERDKLYSNFLESCRNNNMTVKGIANFGTKLMQQAKLHPHFLAEGTVPESRGVHPA